MSDETTKILSDLQVLSLLSVGYTLSAPTMTIINHKSWSGSIWRTYSGENRKQTTSHIRGIFTGALSILKLYSLSPQNISNDELNICWNIIRAIEPALKGVSSLKETYTGDFYTIAEIDNIVDIVKDNIKYIIELLSVNTKCEDNVGLSNEDNIIESLSVNTKCEDNVDLSNEDNIIDLMNTDDENKKSTACDDGICAYSNDEGTDGTKCESSINEMVTIPDARDDKEADRDTVCSGDTISDSENIVNMDNNTNLDMIDIALKDWKEETEIVNNIVKHASENIAKVIVDLSEETSEYLMTNMEINTDTVESEIIEEPNNINGSDNFIKKYNRYKYDCTSNTGIVNTSETRTSSKMEQESTIHIVTLLCEQESIRSKDENAINITDSIVKSDYSVSEIPANTTVSAMSDYTGPNGNTTPVLFSLAKAFKRWVDEIKTEDNSENNFSEFGSETGIKKNTQVLCCCFEL